MPTYVYRCEADHEIELEQPITEEALDECPAVLDIHGPQPLICGASCERVPQRGFFRISGAGVYSPGLK